MNPFRARKKSHDGGDQRPSTDTDVPAMPTPPSTRSRTFRRNKKPKAEPKKEIDLSTALPSNEDFRTSLLMPNLSARFSMLREQDDPNSKLGKANDDSVLFPKRQSRMNLFNLNQDNLGDIAEVASLSGSIRPPFAYPRSNSYASGDGYGTDDDSQSGSVLSRARPGEGNKFFGGRQKIYKIPVTGENGGQDNGLGGSSRALRGRAVYDDDVALSAFQFQLETEKEDTPINEYSERTSRDNERPRSPPPAGYNQNRETSSSTTSGPSNGHISTAATSFTSQSAASYHGASFYTGSSSTKQSPTASPIERTGTKTKRLYGQALEQQMQEQQSSAMHRLDSIQRQRVLPGMPYQRKVAKSQSATSLNERYQKSGPVYSSQMRVGSPTPPNMSGFDLGLNEHMPSLTGREGQPVFGSSPPLSPPLSPHMDSQTFLASIEPNDLGKATLSGGFNKPNQQYNEQQYAQRQLQLHQTREPSPPKPAPRTDLPLEWIGRSRKNSSASDLAHKYSVPQHVNDMPLNIVPERSSQDGNTFLAGSNSDSESERNPSPELPMLRPSVYQNSSRIAHDASVPTALRSLRYEHDDRHPAFQIGIANQTFMDLSEEPSSDGVSQLSTDKSSEGTVTAVESKESVDSPTLPPAGPGLSGMIRAHLRNDSGQSSIYPNSPSQSSFDFRSSDINPDQRKSDANPTQDAEHRSSLKNSWEKPESADPTPLSIRAKAMLDQAAALRTGSPKVQQVLGTFPETKAQQVLGGEAPRRSADSTTTSWQDQLKGHSSHTRGGSTETAKEREAFASEVAERQKRIQESLKSFVETDSRCASPMPGTRKEDPSPIRAGIASHLLKKASRGSLVGRSENPSKAMKMLGLATPQSNGISTHNLPNSTLQEFNEDRNPNGNESKSKKSKPRPGPYRERFRGPGANTERKNALGTRNPPPLTMRPHHATGDRPNTEFSPTSPRMNDLSQRPRTEVRVRPSPPQDSSQRTSPTRPSLDSPSGREMQPERSQPERSQSAMAGRIRSNSKTTPGYFDQRGLLPIHTDWQQNYNGPLSQVPKGSPLGAMYSPSSSTYQDTSPALSTVSSPTMVPAGAFPSTARVPAARKRSINKQDISEPTFMSSTSSVTTIDLPPGASLKNGMGKVDYSSPPPVPPFNPRRRRPANPLFSFGRSDTSRNHPQAQTQFSQQHMTSPTSAPPNRQTRNLSVPTEEQSTFSADESEPRFKPRHRIRKSSSEGGNLAAKARAHALMAQEPSLPNVELPQSKAGGVTQPMF
ncbi:MAG: hypothetical protein MMC33_005669 [Icmadophila ericetorum]|nr:hypothetical protein [Icmadophila ericetorum]